jgi:hypothetical protein
VDLERWLSEAARAVRDWQDGFGSYVAHDAVQVGGERFAAAFAEIATRLTDNARSSTRLTQGRC